MRKREKETNNRREINEMKSERIKTIEEALFLFNLFLNAIISSNNDYILVILTMKNIFDVFYYLLFISLYFLFKKYLIMI